MNNGITILVCTYNGAARLPQTLAHLAKQQLSQGMECEVLVVDNASTDDTAAVAENLWRQYQPSSITFEVITELRPGKIYALEKGISRARYEFFIICDDDNWLAPDYVQTVYTVLNQDQRIGAAGGQSEAVSETGFFPDWFDIHKADYAVGKQSAHTQDIKQRGFLWGAGMGSRKSLYKQMYREYPSLLVGREGERMTAGEDSEYCYRLLLAGYKLWYCEQLRFKHFIPKDRLTKTYLDNLTAGLRESDAVLDKYRLAAHLKNKYEGRPLVKLKSIIGTSLGTLLSRSKEKAITKKNKLQLLLPYDNENDTIISVIRSFSK